MLIGTECEVAVLGAVRWRYSVHAWRIKPVRKPPWGTMPIHQSAGREVVYVCVPSELALAAGVRAIAARRGVGGGSSTTIFD